MSEKLAVVATGIGLIPRSQLQLSIELHESDNAVVVAAVWNLKGAPVGTPYVKRDGQVLVFAPPGVQAEAGATGKVPGVERTFEELIAAAHALHAPADVTVGLVGQESASQQSQIG
jgi:hypothetical protein